MLRDENVRCCVSDRRGTYWIRTRSWLTDKVNRLRGLIEVGIEKVLGVGGEPGNGLVAAVRPGDAVIVSVDFELLTGVGSIPVNDDAGSAGAGESAARSDGRDATTQRGNLRSGGIDRWRGEG